MKLGELLKELKKVLREWGIFFAAAVLLTNLVFTGVVYQPATIDPELVPYVNYFKDVAAQYGASPDFKNLSIQFADSYPVKNWIGLCQSSRTSPARFLTVHRGYFKKTSIEQKYALLIHELGHCTLNLDHKEGYRADGCPLSIMHPSDGMFGCLFINQEYYYKELFGTL